MKKYLLFFSLVSLQFALKAQSDKTPFMTKSLTNESIKDVEVETSGGSISVSGVTSDARVEVYITSNNNKQLTKEEIQQRLNEKYNLDISVANNKVTATARVKGKMTDWKKALNISFKVFVPRNVSTDLSTSGGSIDAKNCEGKLRLSTSGGSLDLKDLKGDIRATTSGGGIHGSDISGELIAHTSGGSIHFSDLTCSLETSTSGGNIDVSITELGKYVKISNSGGNIDVTLPNKGLDLDLSANKIKTGMLNNFSGKTSDEELNGKLNGGGVPVRIDAGSGRISLSLR